MKNKSKILLTGASGIVGHALLKLLPGNSVVCLVHNTELAAHHSLQVRGDILSPQLGLPASQYDELLAATDCVIHAAAETNFSEAEHRMFRLNLGGTRNVLEFARAAGARLYHISTAFVRLAEPSYEGPPANAYVRSKAEAEQFVRESSIPSVIVKPSRIIGESRTGAIARFQGFHFLFDLLLRSDTLVSAAPQGAYVDFVPVDSVASAIARLVQEARCHGEYWLTAGERALTLKRTMDLATAQITRITGRHVVIPQRVSQDVYDKEIKPQLLASLPAELRPTLEGVFQMMDSLNLEPFPSSFPELERDLKLPPLPDPESTLQRNLLYWSRKRGLARVASVGSAVGGR